MITQLLVPDTREHNSDAPFALFGAGIRTPSEAVNSRNSKSCGFFMPVRPVYGWPGGSSRKAGRCFSGSSNFRSVAHPHSNGGWRFKTATGAIIMANTNQDEIRPKILTLSTLEKRIRRKLALDSLALQHTRHGSLIRAENGEWIILDPRTNSILKRHFNLVEIGTELGLIADSEVVGGTA